jgi:dihydropteroate synthase
VENRTIEKNLSSGIWRCGERALPVGDRVLVMGILNVTPDSFSDGGVFLDPQRAVERALCMIEQGADIIDIGGESSRPGSEPIPADVECDRVLPVIENLRRETEIPISIDTCKADVARRGLEAGADIVNDITALRHDDGIADLVARTGAGLVLMHMRGTPKTMQANTEYADVVAEIRDFLLERARTAGEAGVPRDRIVLDPGIGFGKSVEGNFEILARLRELVETGYPVLVGPSRKSFIGSVLSRPVGDRVWGTAAAVAAAALAGAAVVRVHDVAEMTDVVRIADAVRAMKPGEEVG